MAAAGTTHQSNSQMILYVPYTYGNNGDRKGTTEKHMFWHMRNLNIGHIHHIDSKQWQDKNGLNIISWFVHFSKWNGSDELTQVLNEGGHFEVDYDNYNHFWKVMKYTPREKVARDTPQIRMVHKQ